MVLSFKEHLPVCLNIGHVDIIRLLADQKNEI